MHMREYLVQVAEQMTSRPLPEFTTESELQIWRKEKQRQFHRMLGIDQYLQQERSPLNIKITGTLKRDTYRVDKLYYESLPGLYVTGNLYVPNNIVRSVPGIVYVCGHAKNQKTHYQEHARKFAQLGFVTLIIDTIQNGEVLGEHYGTNSYGCFHWISRGYSPAGVEVWNAIRGLDLLSEMKEVDETRLGMTGISGGGATSWWTACADDRVKIVAPSCGTGTLASHLSERTIDDHCDCMIPTNPYGWSMIEMYALIAPRPCLIVSASADKLFKSDSIHLVYEKLKLFYQQIGAEDKLGLMMFYGPHSYNADSRKEIFYFFMSHLMPTAIHNELSDVDGFKERNEDLLVYNGSNPPNDESTTVQDWFIPMTKTYMISNQRELNFERDELVKKLYTESFSAFTQDHDDVDVRIEQSYIDKETYWSTHKFSFSPDLYWRLSGELLCPLTVSASPVPVVVALREAGAARGILKSYPLLEGLDDKWVRTRIDPRGTGDTSWGPELSLHLRRASNWTGRTIASMRVWDVLRGVQAVRSFGEIDPKRVVLAANGDMVAVALYAALLDDQIAGVIIQNPPATQNAPSEPDGTGSAIEIIHSLRYTDLPQIAGLLWPKPLVFIGQRPETYRWTEQLYRQMGHPGGIWHVKSLAEWPGLIE